MIVNSLPENVTWFTSDQLGAPQMMGGSNGDMLKVLDACLLDGWGLNTAESIDAGDDYVTITFQLAHGFLENQIVTIAGAVNPQLNGDHRISKITSTTIDVLVSGVANETGVITAKITPLDWESIFGKTNPLKRAYRSKSSTNGKRTLYLNMDYPADGGGYHATAPAKRASVSVCQDMQVLGQQIGSLTDSINSFSTQPNGSLFWYQKRGYSTASSAEPNTLTKWKIIGNKDFFLFLVAWSSTSSNDSSNNADVFGFGEFVPIADGGQDKTFLMAYTNTLNDNEKPRIGTLGAKMGAVATSSYAYCASGSGFNRKVISPVAALGPTINITFVSGLGATPYPNTYGDALFTMSCRIFEPDGNIVGFIPSLLFIENNLNGGYDSKVVDDVLISKVQGTVSTSTSDASLGFYVGG